MPGHEVVDVVDAEDRVLGSSDLPECLRRGLLHRAVAVVISRADGRVVLQQRSKRDSWHPGKWTLSCTGHVMKGEPYDSAAARELGEELGIRAELAFHGKYLLPPMRDRGQVEREWVALFTGTTEAAVKIDPVEIEGVREYTVKGAAKLLDGDSLTPDSVILLREYLRGRR